MPMISRIGRRHPRVLALLLLMYALLIAGGATMIYPFLLMLAGSTKTAVDVRENRILPSFLTSDTALYRKHIEALFNEQLDVMRAAYDTDVPSFERLEPPPPAPPAALAAWRDFLEEGHLPASASTLGYLHAPVSRATPAMLRSFRRHLETAYHGRIDTMNRALDTDYTSWISFYILPENQLTRHSPWIDGPLRHTFRSFHARQPETFRFTFNVEGYYRSGFLKPQYTRSIDDYNRIHHTRHTSYSDIPLPQRLPHAPPREQQNWEDFVRHAVSLDWVRLDPQAEPRFQAYLHARYQTIDAWNQRMNRHDPGFHAIPLPSQAPPSGLARTDWETFLVGWDDPETGERFKPDPHHLRLATPEHLYRHWLAQRYTTLDSLNHAWQTSYPSWDHILPPHQAHHYHLFLEARPHLRRTFLFANYHAVWDYLVRHGRGVLNTLIYTSLAVLAALLVNPLAAYALSRFRLRRAYTILLVLLLTMAFPPMVTQIPVFLMLRDLQLLNTFAALLLPGLAHGYSIFLLKGFFDSLPRDLYESASIDGAGEWTMFWTLSMSLSKPILAVIALQAFTLAYSNFMYALLICQDERMWTIMVWLYQLQMRSGQGVVYASLIIAALPTLLLFIFCQNIIMRGIVVPVEK